METQKKTLVFGHRGASADAPENTLAAFREAFRQGADGVEGDFHLTADSVVVCIHDHDTQRTGRSAAIVADCTLADLRKLEFGGWKSPEFTGEPIPVLDDLIALIPDECWMVIELKTGPEIVLPLVKTLQQNPRAQLNRILVIAFDEQVIADFKQLMPDVLAHWLTEYQRDSETGNWTPSLETIVATIRRCGANGLGSENRPEVVTTDFVRSLRAAGVEQLHVWTVDSPQEACYYRDLGVFGVTSNYPGQVLNALRETEQD